MHRALVPVLFTVFLDLLGFGIVIPLLTFYAEDQGASPPQVHWLMASYSLAQFVFAPLWGTLSDRHGRRPVMLATIGVTAVCLSGFAAAQALWLLFLFRTLHGAGAANIATAQACVADLTTPERRAAGMGLIGVAFGVGFTLGPWVGGELSAWGGHTTPLWVAAGLSWLNLLLAWAWLPETRREGVPVASRTLDPRRLLAVARHPVVGLAVLLVFLVTVAFAMMESSFTLFAEHVRSLDAVAVGRYFGVAGVVMIVVQGGLIRPLVARFGEAPLVPVGLLLLAVGLLALPAAPPPGPMVTVFCLIALGQGLVNPSLQALISKGTTASEQGFVLGASQSMGSLARAVGPVVASGLFPLAMALPFQVAGLLLGGAVFLSLPDVRRASRGAARPAG